MKMQGALFEKQELQDSNSKALNRTQCGALLSMGVLDDCPGHMPMKVVIL